MIEELDASLWLGELDISNITQFEAALEELLWRPANIVVDMTETEFIDSTTLHVLARTQEQLPGRFAVVIPHGISHQSRVLSVGLRQETPDLPHPRRRTRRFAIAIWGNWKSGGGGSGWMRREGPPRSSAQNHSPNTATSVAQITTALNSSSPPLVLVL